MTIEVHHKDPQWLEVVVEAIRSQGYAIVHGVLDAAFLSRAREAMYLAQGRIKEEVGEESLRRAGEVGVLRIPMKHHPCFFRFLEIPEVVHAVDRLIAPTAILHLQNAFVLPSAPPSDNVFQYSFHQDFRPYFNGRLVSLNALFAIDEFSTQTGATLVVPGTQQKTTRPSEDYLKQHAVPATCPAGSVVFFDSTLWHAASVNQSGADRLAINHQFTLSCFKQQIDYPRALGSELILAQPARTQQMLGYFTRVPAGYDEFYVAEKDRFFRRGQD